MKRLIFTVCFVLLGVLGAQAQCGSTVALSGCVGACGSSYYATYTVTAADLGGARAKLFCLSATSNSLCPNEVAIGALTNSTWGTGYKTILSQGGTVSVWARLGDVLVVEAGLGAGDPNIVCVWQGETHFALTH